MPEETIANSSHEQARTRLLDAAERLFAEHGFSGASIRRITQTAGCNVAAANYYFGGKHGLYTAVFRRCLTGLRTKRIAAVESALEGTDQPPCLPGVLRAFASAFVEPLLDRSDGRRTTQLLTQELMNPALPPGVFEQEMIRPVHRVMRSALRRLVPGLSESDAALCVHSLIGQLSHLVIVQRLYSESIPDEEPILDLSRAVEHVVQFSAAGIRGRGRNSDDGMQT